MKRLAAVVLSLLAVVLFAPPAQADKPLREVFEVHEEADYLDCGFPIHAVFDGTVIRTSYTDKDGVVTRIRDVYPTYRAA